MDAAPSFLQYWWFHLPNYALALMQYAAIGRFLLGLFMGDDWSNYIFRGFKAVSEPAVAVVRAITPKAVPVPLLIVFTIFWLQAVRILFFLTLATYGLTPKVGG